MQVGYRQIVGHFLSVVLVGGVLGLLLLLLSCGSLMSNSV